MKQPLVILAGPTGVGKTKLSIELAKKIDGEIISADSMQVYRGLDIGSAKISPEEMHGVPHFLIDVADPKESFHVVKFQQAAKAALREIYRRGKIPILVGGTGFYIQAVLYDIDFLEQNSDKAYRESLEKLAAEEGNQALHEILKKVDPKAAEQIHPNNVKRTIRALEFYQETGEKISDHNEKERQKKSPYNFAYFVLNEDRKILYRNINQRVDKMMEDGLLQEVERLRASGCTRDMLSMQGLGYKELFGYLDGECTLDEAEQAIKQNTRHFAKRQLTWFRREKEAVWFEKGQSATDDGKLIGNMLEILVEKGIIPA